MGDTAAASDQEAALAAGWVPGRGRDIFKLLRFHVKKNRAQVEALFPPGQELDITQVAYSRDCTGLSHLMICNRS